jgi:hypothetical protein
MGVAGALHNRVDADAAEPFLAKQPPSGINDPLAVLGRLVPVDPRLRLLRAS